jgi:hypothetical protein
VDLHRIALIHYCYIEATYLLTDILLISTGNDAPQLTAMLSTAIVKDWRLKWTGEWFTEKELKCAAYSRFIFGNGTLWPDDKNPILYLISRRDRQFRHLPTDNDVNCLVRAPAHYAIPLRCLLGDIALTLSAWHHVSSKPRNQWDRRHIAIGIWLKYQDLARDRIFDEIREILGEAIFSSPLDPHNPPSPLHHVKLPILEEWILKRSLAIQHIEPQALMPNNDNRRAANDSRLNLTPNLVTASQFQLMYSKFCTSIEPWVLNHIDNLLSEPWMAEILAQRPEYLITDGSEISQNGPEGFWGSYWKRETFKSIQSMQIGCQHRLLAKLGMM